MIKYAMNRGGYNCRRINGAKGKNCLDFFIEYSSMHQYKKFWLYPLHDQLDGIDFLSSCVLSTRSGYSPDLSYRDYLHQI